MNESVYDMQTDIGGYIHVFLEKSADTVPERPVKISSVELRDGQQSLLQPGSVRKICFLFA